MFNDKLNINKPEFFLDSLLEKYEGFGPEDIAMQAASGVFCNSEGADTSGIDHSQKHMIHTNASLPQGAGQTISSTILDAVKAKPTMYNDLMAKGCRYNYPFGTYLARWSKDNLPDAPSIGMDNNYQGGEYSNAQQSQSDYNDDVIAIPMMWYDFSLSKRQIAAGNNSASMFGAVNIQQREIQKRSIGLQDGAERLIWNGDVNIRVNQKPLTGVLTNQTILSQTTSLTFSKSDPGAFIEAFIQGPIQALINKDYDQSDLYVYYSNNLNYIFQSDYTGAMPLRTINTRLLAIDGIDSIKGTKWLNSLSFTGGVNSTTNGRLVVVKMVPEVINLAVESEIKMAQYANNPNYVKYTMFNACAPRIMEDYYGKVGVQLVNITVVD